jgi:hypothetical protein
MHSDPPQPPPSPLQQLLATWRIQTTLPPDFRNRVWLRLARCPAAIQPPLVDILQRWLTQVFLRPAWSIGYALILLGAGMLVGYLGAREQTERWNQHMAQRYVQSVDPYFNPR